MDSYLRIDVVLQSHLSVLKLWQVRVPKGQRGYLQSHLSVLKQYINSKESVIYDNLQSHLAVLKLHKV
ncbi:MAG: hypothetical protein AAGI38_01280 [Bacteroidota bacterium]